MIKNIIFDFGGVLTDLNRDNAVKRFKELGLSTAEDMLDKYHQKGIFLEVENGRIDAKEFCHRLGKLCNRPISFEEAKQGWLAFFADTPQYKLDFLLPLKEKYKLYILSNTNPFVMSWARSNDFTSAGKPLDFYVDKIYTSYELKAVKPDKSIFEYMIADTQLDPEESLFVDDGSTNIKVGNELGFHSFQPLNGEDWREPLIRILTKLS